jgi:putative phosphoesterase
MIWNGMRIAVISDVHGNLTALEAVIADLRETAPDLVLHGGDLAGPGSRPAEVVDRIRTLGWPGVLGNTDEMLFRPESLPQFPLAGKIEEMAAHTRAAVGADRLAWLQSLPLRHVQGGLALVHASPDSTWRSPAPQAADEELAAAYRSLNSPLVVYGHIHRPFIRAAGGMTIANSGSAGLPYDGDRRACYLLLDDNRPQFRRVEYDVESEVSAVRASGLPYADWTARMLQTAAPQMP